MRRPALTVLAAGQLAGDGQLVQVHVWRFAGGWAAFTDAAAGVYLSVAGVGPGTGPEDLGLAALRDGRAYHFDLDGPLSRDGRSGGGGRGRTARAGSAVAAPGLASRPAAADPGANPLGECIAV